MANLLVPSGRSYFARGEVAWESDEIRALAMDVGGIYTEAELDALEFQGDLDGGDILDSVTLSGTTVLQGGVCDADDTFWTGVTSGLTIRAMIITKWTGDAATSPLLYYADRNEDGSTINRSSDGTPIPLTWSSSAFRVFKL